MPKFLLDTNILQAKIAEENLPKPIYVSAIVLSEMMTACNDTKELRAYQLVWKTARANRRLIVPTESDWLGASRIQFLLAQERKTNAGGKAPKRPAKVKQELALDCLIAVSCAREDITVITNDGDFEAIRRYLKKMKLLNFR